MRHLVVVLCLLVLPASAVAADRTGPRIRLSGLPAAGGCRTTVKVGFRVTDRSGVKRILVFYDGRVAGRHEPGQRGFRVSLPKRSRPGRHRLGVLARDNAGNRAKRVVHFRLCR